MRTFVAVADAGRFRDAADEVGVTQQAASKRVAALERELGVRLFDRTPRGAELTVEGRALLPHARALLEAERLALRSVLPGRRTLRVDVINRRIAPAGLMHAFHRAHPGVDLEIVTLTDVETAVAAVASGTVDATFRAMTPRRVPDGVRAVRILDEPLQLLTGPDHPLAAARALPPRRLAGHRIWMPGNVAGTEWTAYYDDLTAAFGLTVDAGGPNFGTEALLEAVAGSPAVATFIGEQTRLLWPAHYGLRRIPLRDPTPVYPHSLVWRADNRHPALTALREHLGGLRSVRTDGTWTPAWARSAVKG